MKKALLMTLFGAFVFTYYIFLAGKSFEKVDDGWGTDISMDMDLLVKSFVGLALFIGGLVAIIKIEKHQDTFKAYNTSILTAGMLMCIYPLGLMFKMIAKHKSGDVIVDYLIWAIFGAFILAYGIISYIENKKKLA